MHLMHWCRVSSPVNGMCPACTPVAILWTLLSLVLTVIMTFAFLQPSWFLHPDNVHSFGIWNRCGRSSEMTKATMLLYPEGHVYVDSVPIASYPDDTTICQPYGGHEFNFSSIPSRVSQAACVLLGGGCVFLALSSVIAVCSLCSSESRSRTLRYTGMYLQIITELMVIAGLLVYSFALRTPYFRYYCGNTDAFHPGHCHMGGAYMLSILCSCIGLFCPILARCADLSVVELRTWKMWQNFV